MSAPKQTKKPASARIVALDYLRGFFILVIIIDHLWRWPNLFQYVTGRGELWVSAAEGFVMISGLLVGYVHGYKKRSWPLRDVAKKLIARGVMLYVWMLITTVALVAATWYIPMKGSMAYIPFPDFNWSVLMESAFRLDYVHSLTHFLYLYAIFLVIAPAAIALLRKGSVGVLLILSALLWLLGFIRGTEWMQWQVLFFMPAAFGYYLDHAFAWYRRQSVRLKLILRIAPIAIFVASFTASLMLALPVDPGTYQDPLFTRRPLTIYTVGMAFVWFFAYLSIFQYVLSYLQKYTSWLLPTLGERSLTAYIAHAVPLVVINIWIGASTNIWINTLLTAVAILATWAILKIPGINRVIPR